jgi:hypothetical protein
MLRANIGLSRKISRDYQSTGYSINLDAEIAAGTGDAEAVLERVHELFDLAEEALNQEIERDQGEQSIGRRDEESKGPAKNGQPTTATSQSQPQRPNGSNERSQPDAGNGHQGNGDAATNKQVQFILTMGKRFKLSTPQLENRIGQIIGRKCGVYDLTKREAGLVLDQFTNGGNGNSRQQ